MVLASKRPIVPAFNTKIKNKFKIIVEAPKIKLDKEYNFISPNPLERALLKPINILDITKIIKIIPYWKSAKQFKTESAPP